jgi:DDE superfamily endonuclease
MWCIGTINAEYRARMYDILNLYGIDYNPQEPVICVDEKSKQLIEETRKPILGTVKKQDYEYKRHGTQNIFVAVEPLAGQRVVQVTDTRKKADFAHFIKDLKEHYYKDADKIHIVLDNLNTHFKKSFVETFGETEAQEILKNIVFHYTPKHASWLNMAEIEIGVMDKQCLNRRIPTKEKMIYALQIWQNHRNQQKAHIKWNFSCQDADRKLSHHYVI